MPRIPRTCFLQEEGYYHIVARGNNKYSIFEEPRDFVTFKSYLKKYKDKYSSKLVAYCLMSNHYHLLLKSNNNLPKLMGCINTRYACYYNRKYNRNGHLFQGRYKCFIVSDDPYLVTLTRYIHQNPTRAKIVDLPTDYPYSSLRDYNVNRGIIDFEIIRSLIDFREGGTPIEHILS